MSEALFFFLRRRITLSVIVGLGVIGTATAATLQPADFLKTDGPVIRRESGHGAIVVLRGTNLGGGFMQEAWMSPNGTGALRRSGWNAGSGSAVLDGDPKTSWKFDATKHDALTVTFGKYQTFDRLGLVVAGDSPRPDAWSVSISRDGSTWTPAHIQKAEVIHHEFVFALPDAPTAKALRVEPNTGAGAVAELNLYQSDDFASRCTLVDRFGQNKADELIHDYQRTWITPKDLDALASWGVNVVRVPMNWLDFMTDAGAWKSDAWQVLDPLVAACGQRGLYVILDLHAAPGGASPWASSGHAGDDGTGQNPNGFWTNPAYLARTETLWTKLAEHYRGNPIVAGYDVVNEPVYHLDESTKSGGKFTDAALAKGKMLDRLYRAVRSVDPDHIVFIPAFYMAASDNTPNSPVPSSFEAITPPSYFGWTNVVYQTHHYDMAHYQSREAQDRLVTQALADLAQHQKAWNVPMYAGEYSLYNFYDVWAKWMAGLNALHISWTNWTYKVRGRADEPGGSNWGFFNSNQNEVPDMVRDSADEIAAKWARFDTGHFKRNDALIEVVRRYTSGATSVIPAAPTTLKAQ